VPPGSPGWDKAFEKKGKKKVFRLSTFYPAGTNTFPPAGDEVVNKATGERARGREDNERKIIYHSYWHLSTFDAARQQRVGNGKKHPTKHSVKMGK
jgi:hypothetical protein